MIDFDKIVKKLWKMRGQFIDIDDIASITDPDFKKRPLEKRTPTYKILYRLKAMDIITPVRQGLYFVSDTKSPNIHEAVEEQYWQLVKKILQRETGWEYFISGNKALEVHLRDYSAPKKLIVYSRDISKNIRLSDEYELSIRIMNSGKKSGNKNLFSWLKKYILQQELEGAKMRIASPELSILDALLIRDESDGIDRYLIEKYIKRGRPLDRNILWFLVSQKYITSINRLKEIAKETNNSALYQACLDIIKKEGGGCFIANPHK